MMREERENESEIKKDAGADVTHTYIREWQCECEREDCWIECERGE